LREHEPRQRALASVKRGEAAPIDRAHQRIELAVVGKSTLTLDARRCQRIGRS
jgi:hypothetical protein